MAVGWFIHKKTRLLLQFENYNPSIMKVSCENYFAMIKALRPYLEDVMTINGICPKMKINSGLCKLVLNRVSLYDNKWHKSCWTEQLLQELKYNQVCDNVIVLGTPEWILIKNYKYHT